MGTALLILVEIVAWGLIVVVVGAALEAGVARIRRRRKQTLLD